MIDIVWVIWHYFRFRIPLYQKHKFAGEHYWEIGKRNYPLRKILNIIEKWGVKVVKHYSSFYGGKHIFILQPIGEKYATE